MRRKFAEISTTRPNLARRERVEQYKREMLAELSLAELRRARRLTQVQLAAALETTQPAVSRIERQTDLYLSTLRSYIEAMGGSLVVEAMFPDGRIPITAFGTIGAEAVDDDVEGNAHRHDTHSRPAGPRKPVMQG